MIVFILYATMCIKACTPSDWVELDQFITKERCEIEARLRTRSKTTDGPAVRTMCSERRR